MTTLRTLVVLTLLSAAALAQPTPEEFLGYPVGARFTPHHRIVAYFEALAAARPDRISLTKFGQSWEGRPLIHAVIASEERRGELEAIRASIKSLSDPRRTTRAEAERIAASAPAVVWLAFGVHGNESSSAEAAMLVASRLMGDDEAVRRILRDTIVVLDPLQNPDGRERYVQWFESRVGRAADPDPEALEHYEPWPGGRYNHYLVDMNRDWTWGTQQETRARIEAYRRWKPQVFVDFHEMGSASNYFFPPDADPINTNIDPQTGQWLHLFGSANAEAFSEKGWPFFVGEHFDLFYPGYGDSWPSLQGAIGMTYEMAGQAIAGRAVLREDDTLLTLADRAERHFTTAMATLGTAAAQRRALLLHTWEVLQRQMERPEVTFLLPPGRPSLRDALELFRLQDVEVRQLRAPRSLRAESLTTGEAAVRTFPAGTAVISTRQPLGALVTTLMERTPGIEPEFIEAQRQRVQADEPDEFYDITAWSVPVVFNLEAWTHAGALPADATMALPSAPAPPPPGDARFAWVVDGMDPEVYRVAGELLRRNVRFSVSGSELRHGGEVFSRGSLVVQRHNNDADVHRTILSIANAIPARIAPLASGWDGGLALGSHKVVFVRDPRIAIAGGDGTAPTSFGSLWFTFDRQLEIPHTAIPLARLGRADLSKYRVLILPDGGGYDEVAGKGGAEKLKAWVEAGNTVIAIRRAGRWLRHKDVGISKTRLWEPEKEEGEEEPPPPERYNDWAVPGAAFATVMNPRSFLTFGVPSPPAVLVDGSDVLLPVSYTVDNILTISRERPLVAGFAWPESMERLAGSAWMVVENVGEGRVITFAGEPSFRLFWRGTLPLLLNAALYSPSF